MGNRATGRGATPAQIDYLTSIDSPTIANAIEPFKVRDRAEGYIGGNVRCLFPDLGVMVGHALAVTMTNHHGRVGDRAGYWRMWEALEQTPRPSVLVIQDVSGEPHRCAYSGEVMATMAQRLGAVGIVTDGGLRDLHEVGALGFHYFASHLVVSHGNFEIVDIGGTVRVDGQEIHNGDLLHGDANGIVVVPYEVLDGLPAAVDEVRERERRMMEFIRGEEFSLARAREMSGY